MVLLLLLALIPWRMQLRRYSIYYAGYDLRYWRFGSYVNSVGAGGDVIQANGIGPLQIVFLRPKGAWYRPWPF